MRTLVTIGLCLLLASCGGSESAPTDIISVRQVLEQEVGILALGINRENAVLASQPVSDRFVMGNNIAVRYIDRNWDGRGIAAFRNFFGGGDGVFAFNANIEQTLTLTDIELQGDELAATIVLSSFSSVRVDRTPPEIIPPPIEPWRDQLVFQREGGAWRLISWDEAPLPPEHDEGEGGEI